MTVTRSCAVLTSTDFLGHDTGQHPENPSRIAALLTMFAELDLLAGRPNIPIVGATREQVARVHDPRYLDALEELTHLGGTWLTSDTMCAADSLEIAYTAAGAAQSAVDAVLDGLAPRAFVAVRPPGHHATSDRGMGFCLLNSIAIAAQHALDRGLQRVAILDWDVHHGNGTQDIFYDRSDVLFISLHQYGHHFFPATGAAGETGRGSGLGFNLNIPLPAGTIGATYADLFRTVVGPALVRYQPELILVSAGFDAHERDPLAQMRLTASDFRDLATMVATWADELCDGKVVAILEGGYDLRGLVESTVATIAAFD